MFFKSKEIINPQTPVDKIVHVCWLISENKGIIKAEHLNTLIQSVNQLQTVANKTDFVQVFSGNFYVNISNGCIEFVDF